jgi:hypothetical protein
MSGWQPRKKWRPSLRLVMFAVLTLVATLPLVGLFFFRIYDNQLIRQTQAELIAQSRVLAAVYAEEVSAVRSVRRGDADPSPARSHRRRSVRAASRCAARA